MSFISIKTCLMATSSPINRSAKKDYSQPTCTPFEIGFRENKAMNLILGSYFPTLRIWLTIEYTKSNEKVYSKNRLHNAEYGLLCSPSNDEFFYQLDVVVIRILSLDGIRICGTIMRGG